MFTGCINDNGIDEEIVLDGKYEGEGKKIAVDSKGNIYFIGSYRGTINYGDKVLENEKIEYNENTYEETSYFLARLNNDGSQAWAIDLGVAEDHSHVSQIALDSNDNLYVGGVFRYDDFKFGSTTLSTTGGNDIFVVKLNNNGVVQWAVTAGGGDDVGGDSYFNDESINGLTVHSNGDIYIVGAFQKTAWFGSYNLTSGSSESTNQMNGFVAKLSSNGTWDWATKIASDDYGVAYEIALLSTGDAYVCGAASSWGNVLFGDIELESGGYISKIRSDGTWDWALQGVFHVTAVDSNDDLFVLATGGKGASIAKISKDKEWIEINYIESDGYLSISDIQITSTGEIYVLGGGDNSIITIGDFTITVVEATMNGVYYTDSYGDVYFPNKNFIAKLDNSGSWSDVIETGGNSIALDSNDNLYTTGQKIGPVSDISISKVGFAIPRLLGISLGLTAIVVFIGERGIRHFSPDNIEKMIENRRVIISVLFVIVVILVLLSGWQNLMMSDDDKRQIFIDNVF